MIKKRSLPFISEQMAGKITSPKKMIALIKKDEKLQITTEYREQSSFRLLPSSFWKNGLKNGLKKD